MAIAQWNGVDIPKITQVDEQDELTADEAATAGGKLRRDSVAFRRTWRIATTWMDAADAAELMVDLRSGIYGLGNFWIADFGDPVNTIEAFADPPRMRWPDWTTKYRRIEITIKARG